MLFGSGTAVTVTESTHTSPPPVETSVIVRRVELPVATKFSDNGVQTFLVPASVDYQVFFGFGGAKTAVRLGSHCIRVRNSRSRGSLRTTSTSVLIGLAHQKMGVNQDAPDSDDGRPSWLDNPINRG